MQDEKVKEMLITMLKELQGRYLHTMEREMKGDIVPATNAYWKSQATIVDIARENGIYIEDNDYEFYEEDVE